MSAFRKDVRDLTLYSFYRICSLFPLLFHHSFFHFLSVFCLLTDCYLVTIVDESLNVLVKMALVKAHNSLHLAWGNAQVN